MGKLTHEELKYKIDEVKTAIEVGDKYFHFKDPSKLYLIKGIALFEEDEEPCIIYKALYGEKLTWVRKFSVFFDMKEDANGNLVPRFQKYIG